jgi:hypothetical protein
MSPGFARVEEVASFLKVFGTDTACALGLNEASKTMADIREINFSLSTLLCHFLTKSTL